MEKYVRWVPLVAGTLVLVGLVGLYVLELRDNSIGPLEDAKLRQLPESLLALYEAWPLFLGWGIVLNLMFNSSTAIGHWYRVLDQRACSPLKLYEMVETGVAMREVPGRSTSRPLLRQRGVFSSRREHLRIRRDQFHFDLHATQFGRSLGVAWRCYRKTPPVQCVLLSIPVLNWALSALFFRQTTYYEDQGLFFQETVHACVTDAIQDALRKAELSELDGEAIRPIHADILKRWR